MEDDALDALLSGMTSPPSSGLRPMSVPVGNPTAQLPPRLDLDVDDGVRVRTRPQAPIAVNITKREDGKHAGARQGARRKVGLFGLLRFGETALLRRFKMMVGDLITP